VGQALQFRIDEQTAGRRLDHFLAAQLGGLSRMRIANLIAEGACLVNKRTARPGYHLEPDDLIEITIADGPPTSMDLEPIPLEIIYEDSHLLVVVKPSGMLVHPTRSVKRGTLANALAYHLNRLRIEETLPAYHLSNLKSENPQSADPHGEPTAGGSAPNPQSVVRPGIVHRLDRDTSGLMVIAKSQRALSILSRHFNRRLVRKRYVALVRGTVSDDAGEIRAPIGRDPDSQPHWRVMESGKAAETRFRVLEKRGDITMVELEPVTGRTNQLRIHCAYAGHAILGDRLYADAETRRHVDAETNDASEPVASMQIDQTDQASASPRLRVPVSAERLCLHACELAFHHPAGGEWMEFHSPLPADIVKVLSPES
jgi:23S rRNA pseudouridine1911/1915/1917 synthase